MKKKESKTKNNVLLMPNQISIVSVASLLKEIIVKEHRKMCEENGVNPEDFPLIFHDFSEK
jgi:hypothetical protein